MASSTVRQSRQSFSLCSPVISGSKALSILTNHNLMDLMSDPSKTALTIFSINATVK
jgi:hypothetical protein